MTPKEMQTLYENCCKRCSCTKRSEEWCSGCLVYLDYKTNFKHITTEQPRKIWEVQS